MTLADVTMDLYDQVLANAERETGLCDWGDGGFKQRLRLLTQSLEHETPHDAQTRADFVTFLTSQAVTRLRLIQAFSQNPEHEQLPLQRPLFVTGMPRTGTTILQNLLSLDPLARPLYTWESLVPLPPPRPEQMDNDPRIAPIDTHLRKYFETYPALAAIHELRATDPNECEFPLSYDCASHYRFRYIWPAPSFFEHLLDADMKPSYRFYKRFLQLLSQHFAQPRWVLKAPLHLPFLDDLLAVFPDAAVVVTHREPREVVGSMAVALQHARPLNNPPATINLAELGRESLTSQAAVASRYLALRPSLSDAQVLDVDYRDVLRDPLGLIQRIYAHFDYPFVPEFGPRITDYLAQHGQHRHGRLPCELADFALTGAEIDEHFAAYRAHFGAFLPPSQ